MCSASALHVAERRALAATQWIAAAAAAIRVHHSGLLPALHDGFEPTLHNTGGLGGRLDHVLSALSTLHKWSHLHIILWGDGSTAQLLGPGSHVIKPAQGFEGPTCGLVPLNGPATLTTKGLKWNMGKPTHSKSYKS